MLIRGHKLKGVNAASSCCQPEGAWPGNIQGSDTKEAVALTQIGLGTHTDTQ